MNYCPDINSKDFKKMVEHLGEDLAYHVWDKNGGNSVEYAPNGEKSIMFESLKNELGEKKAYEVAAKTHSKAFKEWFGNSKVVDKNGQPLVVYHATQENFNSFSKDKQGSAIDNGTLGSGFYFTSERENVNNHARNLKSNTAVDKDGIVMPVFLSINKPLETNSAWEVTGKDKKESDKFTSKQQKNGKDGVIAELTAFNNDNLKWFVSYDPTQIKSISNQGTFDKKNADIRFDVIEKESSKKIDKNYLDAIKRGDLETAQKIIDQQAVKKGYISNNDYKMSHRAPSADTNSVEEKMDQGGDFSLEEVANGHSSQPDDYFDAKNGARWYMYDDRSGRQSARAVRDAMNKVKNGEKATVTIYRAVPKSLKEGSVRNGDWVSLSENYATEHAKHVLDGSYKIISKEVPISDVWWDGNDINEWGYDDGKNYVHKDTKNNLKLNDPITYDDYGNIIPPSKRFNSRSYDPRFDVIDKPKTSENGLYSPTEKALSKITQEKGTKDQFKAMLLKNGAKQAELDWMGFDELPEKLTKSEVQKWIDENKIDVKEVTKVNYEDEVKNDTAIFNKMSEISDIKTKRELTKAESDEYNKLHDEYMSKKSPTKFSQHVLTGGENYKELLLTMPTSTNLNKGIFEKLQKKYNIPDGEPLSNYEDKFTPEEIKEWNNQSSNYSKDSFHSSHYDEPNILAHIRFNERKVNGEKVLFVEEFQSDFAQAGRKNGFRDKKTDTRIKELDKELNDLQTEIGERYAKASETDPTVFNSSKRQWAEKNEPELSEKTQNALKELNSFGNRDNLVPDMPFKQTDQWLNLAARRMMRYAAENGFDRIAWTNGEQQADRYDLSKQISMASAIKNDNGTYNVVLEDKRGDELDGYSRSGKRMTPSEMEDNLGKELSRKLIEGSDRTKGKPWPKSAKSNPEFFTLRGVDLKIGGEGMKSFYDGIVPSAMNKLGKPFGAKVEDIKMGETSQQSIPVTDSMKESVMKGVPLFDVIDKLSSSFDKEKDVDKRHEAAVKLIDETKKALSLTTETHVAKNHKDLIKILEGEGKNSLIDGIKDIIEGNGGVRGLYYDDKIYLVSSNMSDSKQLLKSFLHEQTHLGNDNNFEKEHQDFYDKNKKLVESLIPEYYYDLKGSTQADEAVARTIEKLIDEYSLEEIYNGKADLSSIPEPIKELVIKSLNKLTNGKYEGKNGGRGPISGQSGGKNNEIIRGPGTGETSGNLGKTSTEKNEGVEGRLPEQQSGLRAIPGSSQEVQGNEEVDPRGGVYNSPEYKLANKVHDILKSRGIDKGFSASGTSFGNSVYFTVYGENSTDPKLKIRISDHSVENKDRIFNEQHESASSDPKRIADDIELAMYPERYNKIESGKRFHSTYDNKWVDENNISEDGKYHNISTIEDSEASFKNTLEGKVKVLSKEPIRISKSGNQIYKYTFDRAENVKSEPTYKYERKEGNEEQKLDISPNLKDYGDDINKYTKDVPDYYERKAKRRAEKEIKIEEEKKATKEEKKEIPFPKIPIGTSRAEVKKLMEEYKSQVLAQSGIDLNEKVSEGNDEPVSKDAIKWIPGVTEGTEFAKNVTDAVKTTFIPYKIGEDGKLTKEVLSENLGHLARRQDIAEASMRAIKKRFNNFSKGESLKFIDNMERGLPQHDEELDTYANIFRNLLDKTRDNVQALGTGKLDSYIENYFPHMWKDPKKAANMQGVIMGKKPLEGTKNWLKQRTIEFTKDGVERGLVPVSWNPAEMTMLKVRDMERYVMAHETLNELKKSGIVIFSNQGKPEGFQKIDDKIGTVQKMNEDGTFSVVGNYYAADNAARVINNYLSKGLWGNVAYDAFRGLTNTLTQVQLGLSAFHLGFTSLNAPIQKVATGLDHIFQGNILDGLKEISQFPVAFVATPLKGDQLLKAWYGKPSTPEMAQIAKYMEMAGGRAQMDKFYANNFADKIRENIKNQKLLTAGLEIPLSIIQWASKPILEYIVPRQKMGVFVDMSRQIVKDHPDYTPEELRKALQSAWSHVDNTLGQMVYDNVFWKKWVKDVGMASVRAVGWNWGSIRVIGGSPIEAAKMVWTAAHGKKTAETHKISYLIAMVGIHMLTSSIFQYLSTGKGPQELEDYFFPKRGGVDSKGDPRRVSLPSYWKDIYAYSQDFTGTATNKLSPVFGIMGQIHDDKDYYGTKIYNKDDDPYQIGLDVIKYLGTQFIPFGIRNFQNEGSKEPIDYILPEIGITPAPHDLTMTKAEKRAYEIMQEKLPIGGRTKENAEKSKMKGDLTKSLQESKGDTTKLMDAYRKGDISESEANYIYENYNKSGLEKVSKRLSYDEVKVIYKLANEKEKLVLKPILLQKISNKYDSSETSDKEKFELKKEYHELIKEN